MLLDMYGEPIEYERQFKIKVGFHAPTKQPKKVNNKEATCEKLKEESK